MSHTISSICLTDYPIEYFSMIRPICKQLVKVKICTVDSVMAVWRKLLPNIWKSVSSMIAIISFEYEISRRYKEFKTPKKFQQQKCGNTREMTGIKQLVLTLHVRSPITALPTLNSDVAISLRTFGRVPHTFVIRSDSENALFHGSSMMNLGSL